MAGESSPQRTWVRWSIGAMMLVVAVLALGFAALRRPDARAIAVRMAYETLAKYEPDFRPEDHALAPDTPIFAGDYWRVKFLRVRGPGKAETDAHVHGWQVQMAQRRFWEIEPVRPHFLQVDASGRITTVPARTLDEIRNGTQIPATSGRTFISPPAPPPPASAPGGP